MGFIPIATNCIKRFRKGAWGRTLLQKGFPQLLDTHTPANSDLWKKVTIRHLQIHTLYDIIILYVFVR